MTQEQFNGMYRAMLAEQHGDEHDAYAEKAILAAKEASVFVGDENKNFDWREPITRQDLALVLFRANLLQPPDGE
jgi:hypothetical protein